MSVRVNASVDVCVKKVRWRRGYLATYLTFDLIVRPVPPVLFVGRDHARILVKVWGGYL
jgi:hypothetical protein